MFKGKSTSVSILVWMFFLALSGCGERSFTQPMDVGQTDCVGGGGGMVQLRVGDGFIQRLCGCLGTGETEGVTFVRNQPYTCTVNRDVTVFFHFQANHQAHQVVAVGVNQFVASPVSDPLSEAGKGIKSHTVKISVPGTYQFQDNFDSSIQGTFIVL